LTSPNTPLNTHYFQTKSNKKKNYVTTFRTGYADSANNLADVNCTNRLYNYKRNYFVSIWRIL